MPIIKTEEFLPPNFFNKSVNEKIHIEMLKRFLQKPLTKLGNPDKFEPDTFFGDTLIELTLACNRGTTNSFLYQLKAGQYSSQKLEKDIVSFIYQSALSKSKKHYSTKNKVVSIFVTISVFDWFIDAYGSVSSFPFQGPRKDLFRRLTDEFINPGIFNDVLIIMPGYSYDWFCWSVLNDTRTSFMMTDDLIKNKTFPYVFAKR